MYLEDLEDRSDFSQESPRGSEIQMYEVTDVETPPPTPLIQIDNCGLSMILR
jgi:hypothetical protein